MTGLSQLIRPQSLTPSLFKRSQKSPNQPAASLDCHIDTSPIVIVNDNVTDGFTISGSLLFKVEEAIEVDSLFATLRVHAVHKKPFKRICKACKDQISELKSCQFITTTTSLDSNTYAYPFSYRVPSYVPPSMDTSLVSVTYEFQALASIRRTESMSRLPEIITFDRTLPVARSIPVPSKPLLSTRIYQAAGIEVDCSFDPVLDPSGKNYVKLMMSGLRSCPDNGEDIQFWRHAQEGQTDEKSHAQKKIITLGESSFYDGWNTDDAAGTLNMEFPFFIKKASKFTQDTGDVGDTSVTHSLMLELQLIKETYPHGNPDLSVRTGVGRILRSEHRVVRFSNCTLTPLHLLTLQPKAMTSAERRKSTGGTAPYKVFIGKHSYGKFKDHAGRHYDVVASRAGPNAAIVKLSIQLYCLGEPRFDPHGMGSSLLHSDAVVGWGNARNHWPRIDVYTGFDTVEECIEHHHREKAFRKEAIKKMKDDAVTGLSEAEAKETLATKIQGKEPLPHIVPSWCESARFVENRWWVGDRYRSWILAIPAERSSWEDVIDNGLLQVKFDLDVSPALLVSESQLFENTPEGEDGWVLVEKTGLENLKPVDILRLCAREEVGASESTPGSDKTLFNAWYDATMQLRGCTYMPTGCEGCRTNQPHELCEQEMNEHFNDEDGQCVACKREEEE
ncbi:hypothetical protein FCOIX_5382 [Fusarium coicis]|nr:hypothetical protein FCOIX_5382 [Fusarium coicis]